MTKDYKQFPQKNILFKSTTLSLAASPRTDSAHKMQTHFIQKSFAPFPILPLGCALPYLIQFPNLNLQVPLIY